MVKAEISGRAAAAARRVDRVQPLQRNPKPRCHPPTNAGDTRHHGQPAAPIATGCVGGTSKSPPVEAQKFLSDYIARKYKPERKKRDIEEIDIRDVLHIYLDDKTPSPRPDEATPEGAAFYKTPEGAALKKMESMVGRLYDFWRGKVLSQVSTATCKEYVSNRRRVGGARADLEVLRAAINHHAAENLHNAIVSVKLPPKGKPRERWLTCNEAAHLLLTCWRYREVQTVHRGAHKGEKIATDKRPLRHLARFILIGLYTGTRAGSLAAASPYAMPGNSHVDLERGLFYRRQIGRRATKKRQPPAPLPPRLLAHMRRWVRLGIVTTHFVEWNGAPVKSVKTAFNRATLLAGLGPNALGRVTPHTLRHTAATWLMQRGAQMWTAAGYLGMTIEVLENVYGHHHPDYMRGAVEAITSKEPAKVVLLAERLARRESAAPKSRKSA